MRMLRSWRRPSPAALVAGAALVFAMGGLALAAIPDKKGVIHACYAKKGGALRVIGGTKCRKSEKGLKWNQTGPPGKKGNNGSNGTNGKDGAVAGFSATQASNVTLTSSFQNVASKPLPAGNYIVSGKVEITASAGASDAHAAATCRLTNGTATDQSQWASGVTNPVLFFTVANSTLPFTLAVNSPAAPTTLNLQCEYTQADKGSGSSITIFANSGQITAVQTTQNS